MSLLRVKPLDLQVDAKDIDGLLAAARSALAPEHVDCLERLLESYRESLRVARERGTTITRLQHLFGLRGSERTSEVLPEQPPSGENADGEPAPESAAPESAAPESAAPESAAPESAASASDEAMSPKGDEAPKSSDSAGNAPSDAEPEQAKKRKGHGRIPASSYRVEPIPVELESPCLGECCDCGGKFRAHPPAPITRIYGQPPLVARRWECEQVRCGTCGRIRTAKAPQEAQGPKYTDGAAATLAFLRYHMGMPHHRLDRMQRSMGTPVPATTQYDVVAERAEDLRPVHDELVKHAANAKLLFTDDTTMRILQFMGKRRVKLEASGALDQPERTGIFTTGVVANTEENTIVLFFTGRQHAGENLNDLLDVRHTEHQQPLHMCDGLNRNRPPDHDVVEANCLAHGRRGVVNEISNFPSECRHVLEQLRVVFRNDAHCNTQKLSPEARLAYHQQHSKPIVDGLKNWIAAAELEHRVEPNSSLGKALAYLTKRWDQLTLFLRVAGAPLDNNACERVLKLAIRHRRASLFYRTAKGAAVGDMYMSLFNTAELNGVCALDYVTALLENATAVAEHPGAWLPWNYTRALRERREQHDRAA